MGRDYQTPEERRTRALEDIADFFGDNDEVAAAIVAIPEIHAVLVDLLTELRRLLPPVVEIAPPFELTPSQKAYYESKDKVE
jgi:plasmid stabilization system protein ParE